MLFCKAATSAKKSYERSVMQFMGCYVVVLFCSSWFVKHDGAEHFYLYFWSVIPAIPIIAVIWRMGKYLREETDEYQRWLTTQSILVGTGALMATIVVNDFIRLFAKTPGLPPLWLFCIFCAGMGFTQAYQKIRNRGGADE
jgi:hypothetical protein